MNELWERDFVVCVVVFDVGVEDVDVERAENVRRAGDDER